MIDFIALRNNLSAALADDLGTYTYQDGSTTPAILLDQGNVQYPLQGTEVEGLECLVIMHPEVGITALIGADEETMAASVHLKQWDANASIPRSLRVKVRDAVLLTNPNFIRREIRMLPTVQIVEQYRMQISLKVLIG